MIPGDLASRLRVILEANVKEISVVHEIQGDLPRYQPGDRFRALIQGPLPDGTFRALVAGQSVTLALTESVKSGDSLELQVTEQRNEVIHARKPPLGNLPADIDGDQPKPVLSQAGQIISQLLTGKHGEARPLPLNPAQNAALLDTRSPVPAEMAPLLRQAIKQSGMFYESHLRQWVEGKLPLSSLLAEPQAKQPPLGGSGAQSATLLQDTTSHLPTQAAQASLNEQAIEKPLVSDKPPVQMRPAPGHEAGGGSSDDDDYSQAARSSLSMNESSQKPATGRVADNLTPIVLQQLEAISSNQLSWQGQVLPGMNMQWSVVNPDEHSTQSGSDEADTLWRSNLRVELPNLGGIQARLLLSPQGLSLSLDTDNSVSAEQMRANQSSLLDALEAAGISLQQIRISEHVRA